MRKMLPIVLLVSTICSSAWSLGNLDTVIQKLDVGVGLSRGGNNSFHSSTSALVKFFGQDTSSSGNSSPRVAYSTDGGETWAVTPDADKLPFLESGSISYNWANEGDTLWLTQVSRGTSDLTVYKVVDGSLDIDASPERRDTVTTATTTGTMLALLPTTYGGTDGNLFEIFGATNNYWKTANIDGVWPNTWTTHTDSIGALGSFITTDFQFMRMRDSTYSIVSLIDNFDTYSATPHDMRTNQTNLRTVPVNPLATAVVPHGKNGETDSLIFLACVQTGTGRADTGLWLVRARWHGDGTEGLTLIDSVLISSETERPTYTGTSDTCAPQPVIQVDGLFPERVVVWFVFYPDTANRDRPNIAYRVSVDTGKTFATKEVAYDTTMMNINTAPTPDSAQNLEIKLMNGPRHFMNNTPHVYFQRLAAEPADLLFLSVTLASLSTDVTMPAGKLYTPGVSGMIYKTGISGKKTKP